MKPLRLALVGCGNFGAKRASAIAEVEDAKLVCTVDSDRSRSEEMARRWGSAVCSYNELLDRDDVDAVIISIPNAFHSEYVMSALQRGIHVWCEKPMASSVEEAKKMLRCAIDAGRFLKVGSNVRCFPNVLKVRELLCGGFIGKPLFVRGWIGNSGRHLLETPWRGDRKLAGGGTLLDNGVHLIDLIRWLFGEVVSSSATIDKMHWGMQELEDFAMCVLRTQENMVAFVQSCWFEWAGYMYFEVYGSNGFIRSDNRLNAATVTLGTKEGLGASEDFSSLPPKSYVNELQDFVTCIEKGTHPAPNSFDGYRAVKIVASCYESASSGKVVDSFDSSDQELLSEFSNAYRVAVKEVSK